MNISITVHNKTITVLLHPNKIAIDNDEELTALIITSEAAVSELITAIKKEYSFLFQKPFKVTDASMAVEIWGHIYTEKFADAVKRATPVAFIDKLAEKIIFHCEIINIGEKDHDNNRMVWDVLAPFKPAIAAILF